MIVNSESSLPYPPFVEVEGVINMRSVGGYTTSTGRTLKPNIIYRSGDVSSITERGRVQFSELGIHTVFDFRADSEIKDYDSATPAMERVTMIRAPAGIEHAFDPASIAIRLKKWETDELQAFLGTYEEILDTATEAFRTVFVHLRDHPDEPCLVHCTAGKDRTGMFITLLLMLLGVEDHQIVDEYALTTVGLAPSMPQLIRKFQKMPVFRDNWEGVLNMGSSKPETMVATMRLIGQKYDGVEGYLKAQLNLDGEDIERIQENYLI
ncbi:protein-tyrosine phosphatase-like protein [Lentinula aciculospora]|uniref:Protein-tyrosine phosphatase-like protein n=1 Tax=Lentinula aciculospora TaxID=153920 RepID=A0A9W9ALV6_9AGAR|nr:protein-tyrosine phosphatase-like protein [Lentinula aciculospora]